MPLMVALGPPKRRDFADMWMLLCARGTARHPRTMVPFHAVQLIYRFFLHASKTMRIFSGNLMRCAPEDGGPYAGMKVYEDEHVLGAVEAFLADGGTSLKIVVEKDGKDSLDGGVADHPLVKMVERLKKENKLKGSCDIVGLAPGRAKQLKEEGWPLHHMMIMDRSAYRVETDENKRTAKVRRLASGELVRLSMHAPPVVIGRPTFGCPSN